MSRGALFAVVVLFLGTPAWAGTITFSDLVSEQPSLANGDPFTCGTPGHDPCVQADWLDATAEFTVDNVADTLTIVLDNQTGTGGDPTFDINQLYFSVTTAVLSLSLDSASHSVEGGVTWTLNASTGEGGATHGDGFGVHDYSLTDGVGQSVALVGPGENVSFVLSFTATGDLGMDDFIQFSEQTTGGDNILTVGAAKFVNADPSVFTVMDNDSGFGGSLPEPSTGLLLGLGLLVLIRSERRRS